MTGTTTPTTSRRIAVDEGRPDLPSSLGDSASTLLAYVKQETVGPLKGLGSRVGLALVGALALGLAAVEGLLALLRVLQTETGSAFEGATSWVPYALTLAVAGALAGGLLLLLRRTRSRTTTDPSDEEAP